MVIAACIKAAASVILHGVAGQRNDAPAIAHRSQLPSSRVSVEVRHLHVEKNYVEGALRAARDRIDRALPALHAFRMRARAAKQRRDQSLRVRTVIDNEHSPTIKACGGCGRMSGGRHSCALTHARGECKGECRTLGWLGVDRDGAVEESCESLRDREP